MEMKKNDIKELKEVVDLVGVLVASGKMAMADGKIGISDLPFLMGMIPALIPAVDNIQDVPGELADLDDAEAKELVQYAMVKLQLEHEGKAFQIIGLSFKLAVAVKDLILVIRS